MKNIIICGIAAALIWQYWGKDALQQHNARKHHVAATTTPPPIIPL